MRYVFIANPAAGKKGAAERVAAGVRSYCASRELDCRFFETEGPGHAKRLAEEASVRGEPVRIYGIGGDGTLSEIASGAYLQENVEIGIFPCGSGDDAVRTFGSREAFLNVEKQLAAASRRVDMIRSDHRVSLNLCSIGLDAAVAYHMVRFKRLPLVSGSMAYNLALVKVFLQKIGNRMEIVLDGDRLEPESFLFALAGNGRYYGGGYCGAPEAVPDDGLLDFILIRTPKLRDVPSLVGIYKKGEHLYDPKFRELLTFRRGKRMEVAIEGTAFANYDGECYPVSRACFEIIPQAVRFLVPQ